MKTYVITISQRFPGYHPRKGDPTYFSSGIVARRKKHTIRGNYKLWKKRFDEIEAGRAKLSVREWLGKPYYSKQTVLKEFTAADGIGIQKCDVEHYNGFQFITIDERLIISGLKQYDIVDNDGLEPLDFAAWFKKPIIDGCIIHFTDLRY